MGNHAEILHETRIAAVPEQVVLDIRRVERRQTFPSRLDHTCDGGQRRWTAQIADDWNDQVAVVKRLEELERFFRRKVVALPALSVGLEQQLTVSGIAELGRTAVALESQR